MEVKIKAHAVAGITIYVCEEVPPGTIGHLVADDDQHCPWCGKRNGDHKKVYLAHVEPAL